MSKGKGTGMDLYRLCSRVFNTPMMLEPSALAEIAEVLNAYRGVTLTDIDREILQLQHGPSSRQREADYDVIGDGLAVIPVEGKLAHRTTGLDALSGLMSYSSIGNMVAEAAADPQVRAIVMIHKSPGGDVQGVFDLAADIHAANAVKPVYALVDEMAASASYMLAAPAHMIILPQTAMVGSIGVVTRLENVTKRNEQAGVSVEYLYAGKHKILGSSEVPMTSEGRDSIQRDIDDTYETFTSSVAEYRGMDQKAVQATEAKLYIGQKAVDVGLADVVMSANEAIDFILNDMMTTRGKHTMTTITTRQAAIPVAAATYTQAQVDAAVLVAVGEAADNALAGLQTAETLAAKAEQERILGIMSLEGAEGHRPFIQKAIADGMSTAKVKEYLEVLPAVAEMVAPVASEFAQHMDSLGNPDLGPGADPESDSDDELDKMVASIQQAAGSGLFVVS